MIKYFSNFNKTRWLVSNPDRLNRTGMDGKPFRCPFCPGNEADTPPESHRFGVMVANGPGWLVRVVPNKFNITEIHEVIIHSPDHEKSIDELPLSQVELIIKAYRDRFNYWSNCHCEPDDRLVKQSQKGIASSFTTPRDDRRGRGQVYIFSNHSLASGASLIHPHSQLAVVPNEIKTNTLEVQPVVNIIEQNDSFVSYCPEFSEWAYEVWIKEIAASSTTPRDDNKGDMSLRAERSNLNFGNITDQQISDLAKILQSMLIKLKKIHAVHYPKKSYGYNFYIFVPSHPKGVQAQNWYLRIIPRFMERAGFELSTRIMVNSVDPKKAAEEFKQK